MATRTVGPSGKDHTTIQAAFDASSAGDFIDVYAGTYTDTRSVTNAGGQRDVIVHVNKSGTSGNPITIRAVEAGVILDGGGTANAAFSMHQRQYITIDGFEITNFTLVGEADNGYGIIEVQDYGSGSNAFVTIQNNNIHDNACDADSTDHACINLPGCGAVTVSNNYLNFYSNGTQRGSGVRGNDCSTVTVEDNIIIDPYTGIYFSQSVHNHIYRRNYVRNAKLPGIWSRSGRNCLIYANVCEFISGSRAGIQAGILLNDNTDASAISDEFSFVLHNTSIGYDYGIYIYAQNGATVANNILKGNGTGFAVAEASQGHVFHHNCLHGNGAQFAENGSSYNTGSNVTSDPLFVASGDKPSPYYRLQATSPCIGMGDASIADGLDYDGNTISTSPDMGAFEFQGAVASGPLKVLRLRRLRRVA
jgi:hypothetical protein